LRHLLWLLAICALPLAARAEEGMWPFNMAPVEQVKRDHGVTLTDAWLQRAQRASVRFNNGGSGSFVSPHGLVMTNHHVGADCIQQLSQGGQYLMTDGFLARTPSEERRCPDLELNVLLSIEDVTARVEAAAKDAKDEAAANQARKGAMSALEKACADETKARCDVVTLYAGGAYHLYHYKKYVDVRLAFAPEFLAAFFGGDPENFTYPRTCLDVAFFRVYEDGEPVASPDHFPFDPAGPDDGELVFVSGNPDSTDRLKTPAELEFLRTVAYPFFLAHLRARAKQLEAYMAKGEAQQRAARDTYFGVTNGIKAIAGELEGLNDPALLKAVRARHDEVATKLAALPEGERKRLLEAWPALERAFTAYAAFYEQYAVTERRAGPAGDLVRIARTLLRLGDELTKPDADRLREYRDSGLQSLELRLFSEAPIDPGLQVEEIALGLEAMQKVLGTDDPTVQAVLGGATPRQVAERVVAGTKLADVAVRKKLREGGKAAIDAAKDPLIELVRAYDDRARALRKRYEDTVESVEGAYAGRIAEAWAEAYGQSVYPDATFTLRLNHGVVKGYTQDGEQVPWLTTLGDAFAKSDKAKGAEPYGLPKSWLAARDRLDMSTPYNFVSTNDITGGNSGSPVFDAKGRAVGLIFDGNLQQLPNRFLYREGAARSISVHTAAIAHTLDRVYDAKALRAELLEAKKPPAAPKKK
jgi:hypothetical protein